MQHYGLEPSIWGQIALKFKIESCRKKGFGSKYSIYGLLIFYGVAPSSGHGEVAIDDGSSLVLHHYFIKQVCLGSVGPVPLKG